MLSTDKIERLQALANRAPSGHPILNECLGLAEMLLKKNVAYGDSALNPRRVLSKADAVEQILVRMDDKLNRLEKGQDLDEDVLLDFVGYWVLLQVARARKDEVEEVREPRQDIPQITHFEPPTNGTQAPKWESKFGPVCQNEGCDNRTGNSDRVVCPPCLQARGMGAQLRNDNPVERSSEGVVRR